MTDYRVIIPTESCRVVEFRQEDLPGIAVINDALSAFEPKVVFAWHLSIMLQFEDLILNGMPSQAERDIIDPYGDLLDAVFKGDDPNKPNSLFLARITWNKTRELIYRVFDPEPANQYLVNVIETKTHPRLFDYRIDHDPEWKLAEWHLNAGKR
ncbi:MAG TPA: DUF695 domain-containing protein [Chthoniobacterales bacterium]|jgi:hypothetical protein